MRMIADRCVTQRSGGHVHVTQVHPRPTRASSGIPCHACTTYVRDTIKAAPFTDSDICGCALPSPAMKLCFKLAALALLLSLAFAQDDTDLSPGLRKDREGLLALKSRMSSFGTSQVEMWRASGKPDALTAGCSCTVRGLAGSARERKLVCAANSFVQPLWR